MHDWPVLVGVFVVGVLATIIGRRLLPLRERIDTGWWFVVSVGRKRHKDASAGEPRGAEEVQPNDGNDDGND